MRVQVMVIALCLFVFTKFAGAEPAPEPIGCCGSDATVEYCSAHCIQPPCPTYVCIDKGEEVCTRV